MEMESKEEKNQKNTNIRKKTVDDFNNLPHSSQEISLDNLKGMSSDDEADSAKKQEECIEETSVPTVVAESTEQTGAGNSAREPTMQEEHIEEMTVKAVADESIIDTGINFFDERQKRLKDFIEKTLNDTVEKLIDSTPNQDLPLNQRSRTSSCFGKKRYANVGRYSILYLPITKGIRFSTEGESQSASDTEDCNESCEEKESLVEVSASGQCNRACATSDTEEKDIMSKLIKVSPPSRLPLLHDIVSQFKTNKKLMKEICSLQCEIEYRKLLIKETQMESVKQIDCSELNKIAMEELRRTNKEKHSILAQDIGGNNELQLEDNVLERECIDLAKERELNNEEAMTASNEIFFDKSENTVTREPETNGSPNMCDLISVLGENNETTVIGLHGKESDKNEEIIKANGDVLERTIEKCRSSVEDVNKNRVASSESFRKSQKIETIMKDANVNVENITKSAKEEVKIIMKVGNKSEGTKPKPTNEESVKKDEGILECRMSANESYNRETEGKIMIKQGTSDHTDKERVLNNEEDMTASNEIFLDKSENTVTGEPETNGSPNMCDLISALGENNETTVIGLHGKESDKNEEIIKANGDVLERTIEKCRSSVEDVNKNRVAPSESFRKGEKIETIMKDANVIVENRMKSAKEEVEIIMKVGNKSEGVKPKPTNEESVKKDEGFLECRISANESYNSETEGKNMIKQGTSDHTDIDSRSEISVLTKSHKIGVESSVESNELPETLLVKPSVSNSNKEGSKEFSFNDSSDPINWSTMRVDKSTVTDLSIDVNTCVHLLVVKKAIPSDDNVIYL